MKKQAHRKLSLSLETLHLLDREDLKEAVAGYNYSTSPKLSCRLTCATCTC
jgi:hypothetical protein